MDIFVASTSEHKIGAAREAAKLAFSGKTLLVKGHKAASDINEQPVGHDETLQGALNRLAHLKELVGATRFDLLVAMENGIAVVHTEKGDMWFDTGFVIVEDANGLQGIALSTGIRFDNADVEEARGLGFATTTVGSIIAKRTGADGTDPQKMLTNKLVSRAEMMKQALLAAIGQVQTRQQ